MNILYQCNNAYAAYCGISMTSLFENNREIDRICVYLLCEGISNENKVKFDSLAKRYDRTIEFLNTETIQNKLIDMGIPPYRGSYTTNFKMFIDEFVPDGIERLLYIDSDTVVTGDISQLYNVDMQGKALAMVQDFLVNSHKRNIGLELTDKYYNAGIILFDVKQWKKREYGKRIVEHTKTVRANYPLPDQDLINIVVKDDILTLNPKFNFQPSCYAFDLNRFYRIFHNNVFYSKDEIAAAKQDIRIAHFLRMYGESPWHKNSIHPYVKFFNQYSEISPWKDFERKESPNSLLYRAERIMKKVLPELVFMVFFSLSHEYSIKKSNRLSLKNENNEIM